MKEEDGPDGPILLERAEDVLLRPGTVGVDDNAGGRLRLGSALELSKLAEWTLTSCCPAPLERSPSG